MDRMKKALLKKAVYNEDIRKCTKVIVNYVLDNPTANAMILEAVAIERQSIEKKGFGDRMKMKWICRQTEKACQNKEHRQKLINKAENLIDSGSAKAYIDGL